MPRQYFTREQIISWLEDYHYFRQRSSLQSSCRFDEVPRQKNCGIRVRDNVSNRQINGIMLDQAIESIPKGYAKAAIRARYIHLLKPEEALLLLNISRSSYYRKCREGINFILAFMNGRVTPAGEAEKESS